MDPMNNHTHKMARACLGIDSGVGDFRGVSIDVAGGEK
jgi:hypothetical protein